MVPVTYTPEQQVDNLVTCMVGVVKLRLLYGGWPVAHALADSMTARLAHASRGEQAKAPKRGKQIKRTIKGMR